MRFLANENFPGAAVAALAFTPSIASAAKGGVNVGSLNCTVEGGIGMILGSSKGMTCVFKEQLAMAIIIQEETLNWCGMSKI